MHTRSPRAHDTPLKSPRGRCASTQLSRVSCALDCERCDRNHSSRSTEEARWRSCESSLLPRELNRVLTCANSSDARAPARARARLMRLRKLARIASTPQVAQQDVFLQAYQNSKFTIQPTLYSFLLTAFDNANTSIPTKN